MKLFTKYRSNDNKIEVEALYWDGNYNVYTNLLKEEPSFVGILDDAGKKGKDKIKFWNEETKNWQVCDLGSYLVKTENKTFTVKTREQVVKELTILR
jgi:hypothetical protein